MAKLRPAAEPRMKNASPPSSPWWMPSRHQDRRPFLLARGRIKAAIRAYFESEGFTEVETACLQVSPGNETHLHAFETRALSPGLESTRLFLHTSPEFAMKKLLAAGENRIFSFAPCFRNRERGQLHSPEFTMLEWYRTDEPYETLFADCEKLLDIAARETGERTWTFRGAASHIGDGAHEMTLDEAFRQYAGIPLLETLTPDGPDRDALAAHAEAQGISFGADETWSDIFSRILVAKIDPHLGSPKPTILKEYPTPEAALARKSPNEPRVAERFELFVSGVELANGFGELTDAAEQRARFEADMAAKERIYGERYPIDEDFLAALAHMPPSSGCAMGFDRLVMLATGAPSIDHVIWTPVAGQGS